MKSEPQGVNETYIYEWVSVRTYNGAEKKWNKFSSPVIWAKYGENGVNGVDGINGIDGKNGEGWFLTPIVHEFKVDIKQASDYDDIVGVVKTNFKFAIQHIDGDTNEWVSAEELANYSLNLITDNTYGRNICRSTDTQSSSQVKFEITSVSVNGESIPVISVTSPNYLRYTSNVQDDLNPFSNYYNLHKHIGDSNPSYKNAMFSYITIQLVMTGISIMDTYSQDLIFNPNHIFTASDNALNSVYQGLSGDDTLTGTGSSRNCSPFSAFLRSVPGRNTSRTWSAALKPSGLFCSKQEQTRPESIRVMLIRWFSGRKSSIQNGRRYLSMGTMMSSRRNRLTNGFPTHSNP